MATTVGDHGVVYQEASTPVPLGSAPLAEPAAKAPTQSWASLAVHVVIGALMCFSIFAVTIHYTPVRDPITKNILNVWWDVNPKVKGSGHSEMSMHTYFFFGMILPLLVAFVLVRLVTKGVPAPMPHISHWLRRKPRFVQSLVSYGEMLFLAVVVGGNIIFFYYFYAPRVTEKTSFDKKMDVVGKTFGFSCLYNMVFLALPATRHCFWMEWLNIPYAHGIKYHRWLGVVTILTLVLHIAFYLRVYIVAGEFYLLFPCFGCDIGAGHGREQWVNTFGWLAGLSMLVMGATSLPFVRRRAYNVFYVTHFLFIPAAIFSVLHWGPIVIWLFAATVLYIVNRMFSTATIQAPVVVHKAAAYAHQVTELVVAVSTPYNAGDVVYLKVPAVSKTQWHPFSVASSPLEATGSLTIYIKTLGHWSRQVHAYVSQCAAAGVDPVVYMDGGYPSPAPVSSSYETVVFIGGGIGVTPLMAQIMHLLHTDTQQHVHLIWHVRDIHMMVQFQQWFADATALANPTRLHLHLYVTQPAAAAIDMASDAPTATFDLKAPSVPARPYANLSVTRQVVMMVVAFACAAGLLTAVHYGNKIAVLDKRYWPIQRVVEWFAVVVGAYWAYVVVLIKPFKAMPMVESKKRPVDAPTVTVEAFMSMYGVHSGRADWTALWAEITAGMETTLTPKIGVFVSGPKTLSRAVDAMAHSTLFDVHHEEFEM